MERYEYKNIIEANDELLLQFIADILGITKIETGRGIAAHTHLAAMRPHISTVMSGFISVNVLTNIFSHRGDTITYFRLP